VNKVAKVIWSELLPRSPVFSTSVVAERAGVTLSNASRDLRDLERHGMVTRIRRGLWAVPDHPDFSPYAVVPHLFTDARAGYVSLLSGLSLLGMIEQIPRVVQIVTTSQRPLLRTPVGTYAFHRIEEALFGGFTAHRRTGSFDIAAPEKAVFDALYFSARKGRRFAALPEVELPPSFSSRGVRHWIGMITNPPLRNAVHRRWEALTHRAAQVEESGRQPAPRTGTRARKRSKRKTPHGG
jgi:DNA-binding transcriptional ArsR family regulator